MDIYCVFISYADEMILGSKNPGDDFGMQDSTCSTTACVSSNCYVIMSSQFL